MAANAVNLIANMEGKKAMALDEKSYLIFRMSMFREEFSAQRLSIGNIRCNVDDVTSLVTVFTNEPVYALAVGILYILFRMLWLNAKFGIPLLKTNANLI